MKFGVFIFASTASILLALTKAVPMDLDIPYNDTPPDSGLYTCSEPHWQGDCIYGIPGSVLRSDGGHVCHVLAYPDSQFISFGPDKKIACTVFTGWHCTGDSMDLQYPGSDYLPGAGFARGAIGGGYRTYRCLYKVVVVEPPVTTVA